jgi:hypothetical protein
VVSKNIYIIVPLELGKGSPLLNWCVCVCVCVCKESLV